MAIYGGPGRHKQKALYFLVPVVLTLASISCTDFFTNTLAPWAARDPRNLIPDVTVDNVGDLVAETENNPDMALGLLEKIKEAADSASGDDKTDLQAAALETAANAAGIGQAILDNAGKVTGIETAEDAKKLVADALDSMANLEESAALLSGIVPPLGDSFDPDDPEHPFNKMTAAASAEDLAMAALVLVAAEAKKQEANNVSFDDYVEHLVEDEDSLEKNEELAKAMALAAALEARTGELSPSIRDALSGLNLL